MIEPTGAAFRRALARFGSGVTVITVRVDGQDQGMTASAFSSLSLDPPLVMVAVRKQGRMHDYLERVEGFSVNVLAEHQEDLSNRFAGGIVQGGVWAPWPDDRDKFADLVFERGRASGAPLLDGCLAGIDCVRHAAFDGGDHTVFVGKVGSIFLSETSTNLRPLVYFGSAYHSLSRDPAREGEIGLRVPGWFE